MAKRKAQDEPDPSTRITQTVLLKELGALCKKGVLEPSVVLAHASDEAHPLHKCFTWDDTEAAHQWRTEEARRLIRSYQLKVVVFSREVQISGFVKNPEADPGQQGYVLVPASTPQQAVDIMAMNIDGVMDRLERSIGLAKELEPELPKDTYRKLERVRLRLVDIRTSL